MFVLTAVSPVFVFLISVAVKPLRHVLVTEGLKLKQCEGQTDSFDTQVESRVVRIAQSV